MRLFLTPRWVALHVVVWAAVVTMVLLGRWQLTVSNRKHFDLQNFGYTMQWWAFSAFLVLLWLRIMRDARRPPEVPARGAELVLRSGQVDRAEGAARVGRGYLSAPSGEAGQPPVVYRGYLMPNSATTPARSEGDGYHGAYNDYLWELSLADAAGRARSDRSSAEPDHSADAARAIDAGSAPAEEPTD